MTQYIISTSTDGENVKEQVFLDYEKANNELINAIYDDNIKFITFEMRIRNHNGLMLEQTLRHYYK